jgi:hypothetical protein
MLGHIPFVEVPGCPLTESCNRPLGRSHIAFAIRLATCPLPCVQRPRPSLAPLPTPIATWTGGLAATAVSACEGLARGARPFDTPTGSIAHGSNPSAANPSYAGPLWVSLLWTASVGMWMGEAHDARTYMRMQALHDEMHARMHAPMHHAHAPCSPPARPRRAYRQDGAARGAKGVGRGLGDRTHGRISGSVRGRGSAAWAAPCDAELAAARLPPGQPG